MATGGGSENVNIGIRMSNQDAVRAVDQLRAKMKQMEDRMRGSAREGRRLGQSLQSARQQGGQAMGFLTTQARALGTALAGAFSVGALLQYFRTASQEIEKLRQQLEGIQRGRFGTFFGAGISAADAPAFVQQQERLSTTMAGVTREGYMRALGTFTDALPTSSTEERLAMMEAMLTSPLRRLGDDERDVFVRGIAESRRMFPGEDPRETVARVTSMMQGAGAAGGRVAESRRAFQQIQSMDPGADPRLLRDVAMSGVTAFAVGGQRPSGLTDQALAGLAALREQQGLGTAGITQDLLRLLSGSMSEAELATIFPGQTGATRAALFGPQSPLVRDFRQRFVMRWQDPASILADLDQLSGITQPTVEESQEVEKINAGVIQGEAEEAAARMSQEADLMGARASRRFGHIPKLQESTGVLTRMGQVIRGATGGLIDYHPIGRYASTAALARIGERERQAIVIQIQSSPDDASNWDVELSP